MGGGETKIKRRWVLGLGDKKQGRTEGKHGGTDHRQIGWNE
jgi:hypothetical protein